MQFFSATALLALAASVSAAPLVERANNAFTLISARSGSPVHLLPVQARGLEFWLGGNASTYCPTVSGLDCSQFKNFTGFVGQAGNPTSIGLSTNVPGGQQVYIAPGGAVKFTQAHSASMPAGSIVKGFAYTAPKGSSFGDLAPVANSSNGFLGCPASADKKQTGPFQVFANVKNVKVPSGCVDDCWGFDALANSAQGPAAWQYA